MVVDVVVEDEVVVDEVVVDKVTVMVVVKVVLMVGLEVTIHTQAYYTYEESHFHNIEF